MSGRSRKKDRTRESDAVRPSAAIVASGENVGIVLDAVRQARRMAAETAAAYHGVFVIDRSRAVDALSLCFDRDFPHTAEITRQICGPAGATWLAAAPAATMPLWWAGEVKADRCPAFTVLACAQETRPLLPDLPGLALPLFGEEGITGYAVFAGAQMALDEALLCDLHIRAFRLFGAIARLRLAQADAAPQVSRRELQCLKLTADGKTSEEIAERLGLSVHTANQYLATTTQKLNAVNRMHAVAKALRMGLID